MPDPVYRGMTRTPLWLGVPVKVAVLVHLPAIFAIYLIILVTPTLEMLLLVILLIPIHLGLREITRNQPKVWRQIGLFFNFRILRRDRSYKFWQASTYGPGK